MPTDAKMTNPKVTMTSSVNACDGENNSICFEIENTGREALQDLVLRVSIPFGEKKGDNCFLLRERGDHFDVDCSSSQFSGSRNYTDTASEWATSDFGVDLDANSKITIVVAGFPARDAGQAPINLVIVDRSGNKCPFPSFVKVQTDESVRILDFTVSPLYGREGDAITISGCTANARLCKVWRGTKPIKIESDLNKKFVYSEKLSRTTTFKLIAYPDGEGLGDPIQREVLVTMERNATWDSRHLLDDYDLPSSGEYSPALLLSAKGLRGEEHERLYGVFTNPKTKASRLYSSASGVDNWQFEADVPEGMGESPGVIHDKKLWLIGGSSADPEGLKSNRICCWYKRRDGSMDWKDSSSPPAKRAKALAPAPFSPRNCHACAVFQGKIWVLGGLGQAADPLNDVWICTEEQTPEQIRNDEIIPAWKRSKRDADWNGRCMFAVAVTIKKFNEPRLWVYGGTTHPYELNPFGDLWFGTYSNGEIAWTPIKDKALLPDTEGGLPRAVSLLVSDDDTLHLAGIFAKVNNNVSSTFHVTGMNPFSWSKGIVDWNWRLGQNDMFDIVSIQFNGRRIFVPLYYRLNQVEAKNRMPRIYVI